MIYKNYDHNKKFGLLKMQAMQTFVSIARKAIIEIINVQTGFNVS